MSSHIEKISDLFWSIRSSFKVGGVVNIGTHASLVQRPNGRFLMLDACGMSKPVLEEIYQCTENGDAIDAIIHLHPFHTKHVKKMAELFPNAKLYGTVRHHEKAPDLAWQPELSESKACADLFQDVLEFSVPKGVDFVSQHDSIHFSSVLAYHPESRTIHSDDTLMYLRLPGTLKKLKKPQVSFHPTLRRALEPRVGAADDFRQWALGLAEQWGDAENLCAAHTANLLDRNNSKASIAERILRALKAKESTLRRHERRFG